LHCAMMSPVSVSFGVRAHVGAVVVPVLAPMPMLMPAHELVPMSMSALSVVGTLVVCIWDLCLNLLRRLGGKLDIYQTDFTESVYIVAIQH